MHAHRHVTRRRFHEDLLAREGFCIFLIIWAQIVHESVSTITFVGLSVWSLFGRRQALQALTVAVVVSFLNPAVFPEQPFASLLKWFVLMAGAVRVYSDVILGRRSFPGSVAALLVFCGVALSLSYLTSYEPVVSMLKLVGFLVGVSTILLAFRHHTGPPDYWRRWFLTLFVVVLISSLPLLPLEVGYARNQHGFQGILGQPQAYAILMSPLLVIAASDWLVAGSGLSLMGCTVALGGITVLASEARTAVISLALGLLMTMLVGVIARRDWCRGLSHLFRSRMGVAIGLAAAALLVVQAGSVYQQAAVFLTKSAEGEADGVIGSLDQARGQLVRMSWTNFRSHPLMGIGFGVASDPTTMAVTRDDTLGLPIGASTEKGFMPSAILEETGLVGACCLLVLIATLASPIVRRGSFHTAWVFCTCLFLTCGEMVLFSMAGLGLYIWLLISYSHSCPPPSGVEMPRCASSSGKIS